MKRYITLLLIGLSVILSLLLLETPLVANMESSLYGMYMRWSIGNKSASEDIVLITVDQATIKSIGSKWSWNTGRYAGLLDALERQKPKVVVFDYFFPERTIADNADWSLIAKLEGKTEDSIAQLYSDYSDTIYRDKSYVNSNDEDFRSMMEKYGNVFLPYSFKANADGKILDEKDRQVYRLYEPFVRSGFVNASYDSGDRIAEISPRINGSDSLALKIAEFASPGISKNLPPREKIPLNYFSKPYDAFTAIQFHKAYDENFTDYSGKKISLKDKIVLIGDYHESLWDIHKVPIRGSTNMAGVEVLANEVQMYLTGSYLKNFNEWESLLYVALLCLIFSLLFFGTRGFIWHIAEAIIAIAAYMTISYFLFSRGWYVPVMPGIFAIILPFSVLHTYSAIRTFYEKEKIRNIFSKHIDRAIVATLIDQWYQIRPEKKEISILFCDIEGFTSLSEALEPTELIEALNRIFHAFNGCIFAEKWTINKYIGDAIMAFWWAPLENSNHASHAVRTALEMQSRLDSLSAEMVREGLPQVRARIGVNTGEATVGNIGDEHFSDYTVIGDSVNTASRLEWINKYYHTGILITDDTYRQVKDDFFCRKIDTVFLKWKEKPTDLYEVFSRSDSKNEIHKKWKTFHEEALGLYVSGAFAKATKAFETNQRKHGDYVAQTFLARIESHGAQPPENWDGTYAFDVK